MYLNYENKKSTEKINQLAENIGEMKKLSFNKNYLFKGDNFYHLSTLIRSGFKNKVDLIYIDPPFLTNNIFTISEGRNSTISRASKGLLAYDDRFSFEDYLEFIRERLILLRQLLSEEGSIYLHIDTKMGHYIKILMDEVFGIDNFKNDITRRKSNPKNFHRKAFGNEKDLILFYTKSNKNIWNDIRSPLPKEALKDRFKHEESDGRLFTTVPVHAPGETLNGPTGQAWRGVMPPEGRHWRVSPDELDKLDEQGLIHWSKTGNPRLKKYADEHKGIKIQDIWDYKDPQYPVYPTEKNLDMIEMIVLQSSKPNSIVLDCFAGSGGTLIAAYKNDRKFIGIDSSPQAIEIIQNRFSNLNIEYIYIDEY